MCGPLAFSTVQIDNVGGTLLPEILQWIWEP